MIQSSRQFRADAELKRSPFSRGRRDLCGKRDSQDRWLSGLASPSTPWARPPRIGPRGCPTAPCAATTASIGGICQDGDLIPIDALDLHECFHRIIGLQGCGYGQ
jgi:hypothetical protein